MLQLRVCRLFVAEVLSKIKGDNATYYYRGCAYTVFNVIVKENEHPDKYTNYGWYGE